MLPSSARGGEEGIEASLGMKLFAVVREESVIGRVGIVVVDFVLRVRV